MKIGSRESPHVSNATGLPRSFLSNDNESGWENVGPRTETPNDYSTWTGTQYSNLCRRGSS